MSEIHFDSLRSKVVEYINEIKANDPESYSIEWFLLKYLKRIENNSQPPSAPWQVEGSIRSLVRFYIDNVDENSAMGDICTRVYNEYRRVLKEHQEKR
jgi:hypothetical protein